MKPLTLDEVVVALEGTCDRAMPMGSVTRVVIDSRQAAPGDLFVAIRGDRFDGHDFVHAALGAGAMGAVVRSDFSLPADDSEGGSSSRGLLIRVDDTVAALGRLGRFYRRSVIGRSATVVAVTGSNGKTTTKAMIAHLLSGRLKGVASIKSYNNSIGVPLTLLSAEASDTFVICEVGMNAPGEIAALARLIEPEIAVVTCIAEAHLEGLGSLDNIAAEKLSLLHSLPVDGCAVVNADHEQLRWRLDRDSELKKVKRVTFGHWSQADLRLTEIARIANGPRPAAGADGMSSSGSEFVMNGRFRYRLNVPGRHNVFNALAAIAVARRFGMDHDEIAERLASFALPAMRLQCERLGRLTLINDAYNANPASLAAAVDVLMDTSASARRVLVVGDMRELGNATERLHREAGERIGRSGIDLVVSVGEQARVIAKAVKAASEGRTETHAYGSTALARRRLASHLRAGDTVLIKGSRAMALEHLVEVVREWASVPGQPGPLRGRRAPVRRVKV